MKLNEVFRVLPLDKDELLYSSILKFLRIEDIANRYDIEEGDITVDDTTNDVVITLYKNTNNRNLIEEIAREFKTRSKYFEDIEVKSEPVPEDQEPEDIVGFMFVVEGEKGRTLNSIVNQILDSDDPDDIIQLAKEIVNL